MAESGKDFNLTPMMHINDISKMFRHHMRRLSDEAGIPYGYRALLMHLAFAKQRGEDGITQYELAKHTRLTPPTVSVTLQKMERDGYITRIPDETDMRQMRVALTDKGYDVDVRNRRYADEFENAALSGLSDEDIAELIRLLTLIRENIAHKV